MKPLFINGKFLLQRTTGVQRFARNLVIALDGDLFHRPGKYNVVLLTPEGAPLLPLKAIRQRTCGKGLKSITCWEQLILPTFARNGVLLNLAGSAPLLGGTRIPTIHDAAVYLHPAAYSWKFIAWYRTLFGVVTKSAPLRLTVSHNSAKELSKQFTGSKFEVVYNSAEHITSSSADNSILTKHGLPIQRYFLAVASRNPTKNIDLLVRAHASSGLGTQYPLVIAGGGNPQVFSSESGSNFANSGVVFTGAISDSELRGLYENAFAFVFPSLYEGFGIPPLEAMICGCPVLASNASSIPEVCGEAALYFDPGNIQDIVRALLELTVNTPLRDELIVKGTLRSALFSWSKSATTLRRLLEDAKLL